MDELREKIAREVYAVDPDGYPFENGQEHYFDAADRILAIPEIAEALDASERFRRKCADLARQIEKDYLYASEPTVSTDKRKPV